MAVLLVFFTHALINIFFPGLPYFWYLAFAGVEIFFALSGFLIGKILYDLFMVTRGRLTLRNLYNFFLRRWLRTLPLYLIVFFLLLMLHIILYQRQEFNWKYLFFLQNLTTRPPMFFGESWSLSVEEWFYFLFPLCMILGSRLIILFRLVSGASKSFLIIVLSFILLCQISKIVFYYLLHLNYPFKIVVFRLDAIAYGILAYWVYINRPIWLMRPRRLLVFSLGFVAIAAAIQMRLGLKGYFGFIYFFIAGLGYAGIVLALRVFTWSRKQPVVVYLSQISYSIYLTHLSLIFIPVITIFHPANTLQKILLLIIYVAISLGLSSFSYHFIETPFNKLRNRLKIR
jgi:peptidoglycan/LPS O-acetylase OafA/YrhL